MFLIGLLIGLSIGLIAGALHSVYINSAVHKVVTELKEDVAHIKAKF
jgi:hypothetical protein